MKSEAKKWVFWLNFSTMECSIYDALVLIIITNVHMYVCIRTADMMAASFLSARPCKRSSQISSGCGTTSSWTTDSHRDSQDPQTESCGMLQKGGCQSLRKLQGASPRLLQHYH
jgi:hypothetical protein